MDNLRVAAGHVTREPLPWPVGNLAPPPAVWCQKSEAVSVRF